MEQFEEFRRRVLENVSLQEQIRGIRERDEFIDRLLTLGRELGYAFTETDVLDAMHMARRSWIERRL